MHRARTQGAPRHAYIQKVVAKSMLGSLGDLSLLASSGAECRLKGIIFKPMDAVNTDIKVLILNPGSVQCF